MKGLLIFTFLIAISFSFRLFSSQQSGQSSKLIASLSCSDTRVKTVNDSISQCQFLGSTLSTECIKNYMFNHTNGQKWDVIAEIPLKSEAKSSFWIYDDCSIMYNKYGKANVTYTIWKATQSNQSSNVHGNKNSSDIEINLIGSNDVNDVCTQTRTKAAKDAISYCQNIDLSLEVSCIRNNIKSKTGQKWNAVVATEDKSSYSIRYWYFDSCTVQLKSFGIRKRNYLVWKAE